MTDNYEKELEVGLRFQDYVTRWLYREGIPLVTYVSREESAYGENMAGIEIKRDNEFRNSGNLYIETEERKSTDRPFVPSGIYRESSWLLAIGDELKLWILSIRLLHRMHKSGRYRSASNPTSKAFLLPVKDADDYAALILTRECKP